VALIDGDATVVAKHEAMTRGHVERLAPMVSDVLAEAGLHATDLDGIAVTTGPGSFPGARLGVSFARGVALATNTPAVGVSVFEAIQSDINAEAIVALPGKNGSLLLQRFAADGTPTTEPADFVADTVILIVPDTGPFAIMGTAAEILLDMLPSNPRARAQQVAASEVNAEVIARLGLAKLAKNGSSPIPTPLYVRSADAKPQAAVSLN